MSTDANVPALVYGCKSLSLVFTIDCCLDLLLGVLIANVELLYVCCLYSNDFLCAFPSPSALYLGISCEMLVYTFLVLH